VNGSSSSIGDVILPREIGEVASPLQATADSEHTVPREDAEIAAKWGNGYHHAKRTSDPVAPEFSFGGVDTFLDKVTIQKLIYIISK
jgi:hypothetical protein